MYLLPVAIRPRVIRAIAPATGTASGLTSPMRSWISRAAVRRGYPGASSIGQLEANVAAADIVLREDEQQALTAAASEVRQGRVGISN